MAGEKTEKATPKKRRDERKEGHVFSSKDVIAVVSLLGVFYCLEALFPMIYKMLRTAMVRLIQGVAEMDELSLANLRSVGMMSVSTVAGAALPIGIIACTLAIVSTGVQTKFIFATKSVSFKLSNLNILKGIKNLFSTKNLVELLKAIIKVVILCAVLYQIIKGEIETVAQMMDISIQVSASYMLKETLNMVVRISMIFVVIAGFDYYYQRWSYEKQIRMTKQEVKEEYKETEGNPEIKGKIRNLQRTRARNRMMQAVPDADVIIRNPTHYAVALRYDIDNDNAPVLVAKGQDLLALRIIEIGEQNGVTVIENRPLARGIYASTPLDCEIPAEYYGVVAEILVQVFRMNNKKME